MKKHFDYVLDSSGNAVEGASIAVQQASVNVSIYSDAIGTTAANPLTSDSTGYFEFYAADGAYDLVVSYGTVTTTISDVQIYDDAEQDAILDRAMLSPSPETSLTIPDASTRASKLFGFDASSDPEAVDVSTIGKSLIAAADAAAQRTVLEITDADIRSKVPFSIPVDFTTAPTSSEVLQLYTFVEAVTFPDDFAGAAGNVGTNPTGSFALDIQKNGSSVGTVTISTGGAFTFATTGTTVSFAVGDQFKAVGPASVDATIANVSFTLIGARS